MQAVCAEAELWEEEANSQIRLQLEDAQRTMEQAINRENASGASANDAGAPVECSHS